jgi:hypothetical protein
MKPTPWHVVHLPGLSNEETIRQMYNRDMMSITAMAEALGVGELQLRNRMRFLKIDIRQARKTNKFGPLILDLKSRCPELNGNQIAIRLGTSPALVYYHLKAAGIKYSDRKRIVKSQED